MSISRRTLISAALGSAAAAAIPARSAAAAEVAAQAAAPSAKNPIIASFNENPLGLSKKAREAVAASAANCNRYPFVRVETLRKACADFIGGKPEEITLSQGSAEAIRASIEAWNAPGVQLVIPELTYSDGEMAAVRNKMKVTKVKMGPDGSIDIEGMKAAVKSHSGQSIVYFVNPNNPTGTVVDSKPLNDWIREDAKTLFLVDEAYGEFVEDKRFVSTAALVAEGRKNVIVLKTFSKLFGMAGLRLGFAYAHPETAKRVREHIAYDIFMNVPAIEAALSELGDQDFIALSKNTNKEAKAILTGVLDELKIEHLPSETNFVFFNLKAPLAPFAEKMKAAGILVGRPFPPADGWCRLSLALPEEMQYVAKTLRDFRAKGWV